MKKKDNSTVLLSGVKFSVCTFEYILSEIEKDIVQKQYQYISITNTESLYHATKIEEHLTYINNSKFSCCDGIGVVVAGKLLGYNIPRLHGPDLMLKCSEQGVKKKWRHFYYGGEKGTPEKLSEELSKNYPGLIVSGVYSPPFRELSEAEDRQVIEMINNARPDILWVGLGLLKQERWIADHINKLEVPLLVGVGAAFDFYAGNVKRAPLFYRKIGLEWLYRVAFEPRMIKRNLLSFKALIIVLWGTLLKKIK